jgi:hypothetical protein
MNFKTTYILFGVLVGVVLLFLLVTLYKPAATEETDYVFPSFTKDNIQADAIERVEIDRLKPAEEKVVLVRKGKQWWFEQPKVRADNSEVNLLVSQLRSLAIEKKADLTQKLSDWELDSPRVVVTLTGPGGRQWVLRIGRESGGGDDALAYVTSSDRQDGREVLDVRRRTIEPVLKEFKALREKELLTAGVVAFRTSVQDFHLHGPGGQELAFRRSQGKDDEWRFVKPDYGLAETEGERPPAVERAEPGVTGVNGLLSTIGSLRVPEDSDFVDDSGKDFGKYGLEADKAPLRIQLTRKVSGDPNEKDTQSYTLLVGQADESSKEKDKPTRYFARLADEDAVVRVPAKEVQAILDALQKPEAFRNRDLVRIDTNKVDAIDIDLGERGKLKLRKLGSVWKLYEPGQVRDADSASVSQLLNSLSAPRQVVAFPEKKDAELGLEKPAAVVSIWQEGIVHEEKESKKDEPTKDEAKDAKKDADSKKEKQDDPTAEPKLKPEPTLRLVFGRVDQVDGQEVVYVRRETAAAAKAAADVARLAVPKVRLEDVSRGRLAYLDRKLPSFTGEVVKLVLAGPDGTWEVARPTPADDKKGPAAWTVVQPKALAGREADSQKIDQVLDALRDLRAVKLVSEKTSDSDLERFGLLKPRYRVTVVVQKGEKETEDFVYLFGGPEDKNEFADVYAKQRQRDLVFTVPRSALAAIQQESLLDPVVFKFPPTKVTGLKLVGWQQGQDGPTTLDLERKVGQLWLAKSPAKFAVNDAEVNGFLNALADARAARFIDPNTKDERLFDPAFKMLAPRFTFPNGGLEITLTIEDEKEPLVVNIGGSDPDKNPRYLFAKSNRLPGVLFFIPKEKFDKYKSKPAIFGKE